ncbi:MAG: TIGR00266 family protein [Crocosphaera sp.]|nr:TIGR00266 family protein [Crocosphaera sp.]
MKVKILDQRESSIACILLKNDETLMAQAGTLVAMRGDLSINTTLRRSSGKSNGKTQGIVGSESLFLTEFRGLGDHNEIWLAPGMMGNIIIHKATSYKLIALASGYLACSGKMDIFFGIPEIKLPHKNISLNLLSITGKGHVLLNGLGSIYSIDVDGEYWLKTDHLVGFENSLKYEIIKLQKKGIFQWFQPLNFFIKFKGKGKLYCQTHQAKDWGHLIAKQLKSK